MLYPTNNVLILSPQLQLDSTWTPGGVQLDNLNTCSGVVISLADIRSPGRSPGTKDCKST